ncbi:hypothetical protein IL306_005262 [Fusarium sp. DS 682]|nr:hypothetical protein IL306_005262 [Fusarium sp. DS 682]
MIFPNSIVVAFVAFAGVNAGPCRPSSASSSTETSATVTSNIESTATDSTLLTDATEILTATVSESEISTTTIPSSVIETSAAVESGMTTLSESDTTTLFTTTNQELPTTVTSITEATATSEAPEAPAAQCADLANPYTDDLGFEYELRCNWGFYGYEDLQYLRDSTMEKCINACGRNNDCDYAQFQTDTKICILIGTGFDYDWDKAGVSVAVKNRPA